MKTRSHIQNRGDLDRARRSFANLRPIREDYPGLPIEQGFNWNECASDIIFPPLYVVVFRSVRRADADVERLQTADDRAHADARKANGFLFYFKGQLNPSRHCLSFCLWESQKQARAASDRPDHAAASGLVREMYESYRLERYILSKHDDRLVFEPLSDLRTS